MYNDKVVSYVKDALVVWSSYMRSFEFIKWVLHKKKQDYEKYRKQNHEDYIQDFVISSLSIDSYVFLNYGDFDFSINEAQWENTLIKYTKRIVEFYLPESVIKDKYKGNNIDGYCRYSLTVELLEKPTECDYINSLARLLELEKEHSITFPSFLFSQKP